MFLYGDHKVKCSSYPAHTRLTVYCNCPNEFANAKQLASPNQHRSLQWTGTAKLALSNGAKLVRFSIFHWAFVIR